MKIIFMGSAAFAVPSLDALHNAGHEILTVITQPDKPAGRGRQLASPPAANEAKQLGLPLYQPKSIKSQKVVDKIRSLNPELIVVVAYGKILPGELIDIPKLGCINVHASLLPKYRGAAPINWAVVNGEEETGITTMLINEDLDAGDMLLKEFVRIEDSDTAITLHDRLCPLGAKLLLETIEGLKRGSIIPKPQDHSAATPAPLIKKEDGLINWSADAVSIRDLVRGMQPWPTAYTHFEMKVLKLLDVTVLDESVKDRPGSAKVLGNFIVVATGRGRIRINELQLEGKRRMTSRDFLNGYKIRKETVLR